MKRGLDTLLKKALSKWTPSPKVNYITKKANRVDGPIITLKTLADSQDPIVKIYLDKLMDHLDLVINTGKKFHYIL